MTERKNPWIELDFFLLFASHNVTPADGKKCYHMWRSLLSFAECGGFTFLCDICESSAIPAVQKPFTAEAAKNSRRDREEIESIGGTR